MQKRHTTKLKKNTTQRLRSEWIFYDVESNIQYLNKDEQIHSFRLGAARYIRLDKNLSIRENVLFTFTTKQSFVEFVEEHAYNGKLLHICSYNASYDIQISQLLKLLVDREWKPTFVYVKGTTVIIKLKKDRKTIVFVDAMNWLRGNLESWGEKLHLPKLKVNFDSVTDNDLLTYCIRDVDILSKAVLTYLQFLQEHELGDVKITLPSQALTAYRHRFLTDSIYLHNEQDVLKSERLSYGGGMIRLFASGIIQNDFFRQVDVNSMYGYVMKEYDYPYKYIHTLHDITIERLQQLVQKFLVVADCTVHPTESALFYKHKEHIIYPIATFRRHFTTPEIIWLLKTKSIIMIHKVHVYKKKKLFANYIDFFYNLRLQYKKEGNLAYAEMCKLFINGLYGKFGARVSGFEHYKEYDGHPLKPDKIYLKNDTRARAAIWIGEYCFLEKREEEAPYSFVAIAAHVTAYARMYLWNLISKAGIENVFYTDTDSLIVNSAGFQKLKELLHNSELGKLKLETISDDGQTETNFLYLHGRKFYQIGNKIVAKGVSKSFHHLVPKTNIKQLWPTLLSYFKKDMPNSYHIKNTYLQLSNTIFDGIPQSDGRLAPFLNLPDKWPVLPPSLPTPTS